MEEPDGELLRLAGCPPPINNLTKVTTEGRTKGLRIIVKGNYRIKAEIKNVEEGLKLLTIERVFLDRLLYKHHNRFRNDRGYKSLRILLKSVSKLENLSPVKPVANFCSLLPIVMPGGAETHLPPPSLAQFSSVQVWLAIKLIQRVSVCCRSCGVYAEQRLSLGHFWGTAAHHLAVVSRIWTICTSIGGNFELIQDSIKSMHAHLPGPSLYSESVLGKLFGAKASVTKAGIESFNVTAGINSSEGAAGISGFTAGIKEKSDFRLRQDAKLAQDDIRSNDKSTVEIGEKLSRSKFEQELKVALITQQTLKQELDHKPTKNKRSKKETSKAVKKSESTREYDYSNVENSNDALKSFHDGLSELHSWADLQGFLNEETARRKRERRACMSKKLDQDQWKALKKQVIASFNNKLPNKSIKFCRKLLRNAFA